VTFRSDVSTADIDLDGTAYLDGKVRFAGSPSST
jgi:hypothetical protein